MKRVSVAATLSLILSAWQPALGLAQLPIRVVATSDATRAGAAGEYGSFSGLIMDDAGRVTFRAQHLVFTEVGGALHQLYPETIEGRALAAPRAGRTYAARAGVVYFTVRLDDGTTALASHDGGSWALLALEGQSTAQGPLPALELSRGPVPTIHPNDAGDVAFETRDGAVWLASAGGDVARVLALGDTLPGGGAVQSLRVVGLTPGAEVIAELRPTLGAGAGLYTATAAGLSAELVDDALTCEVTAAPEAGRGGHVVLSVTRRLSETSLSCDLRDALVWSPTGSPALIGDGEFTFDPATAHSGADGRSVVVAVTSEVEPRPVVYELSEGGRRALALAGDRLMGLAEPLAFVGPTRVAGERAFFRGESETGVAVLYQADPFGVRPALSRDTVVDVAPGDQRQIGDWTLSDANSMNSLASILNLSGGAPGGASLAVVVLGDAPAPPEPRIDLSLATASSGLALDVTLTLRAARTNASEGAAPAITLRFPADAMEPDEASLERAGCHALDAGSLECARDSDTVPPGGDYSVTFRVWVNAPAGDAIELHASAELSFASGLARAEADATVIAPSSQAEVWVRPLGEGAATTSPTGLGFQIGNAGPDVATEVRLVVPGHPLCAEGCLIGDVSPGVVSVLMDESVLVGLEGVARVTTTALDSDLSNNSAAFDFRPLRGCSVGGAEAAPWPVLFALGLVCLWGRRARRAGRAR